MAAETLTQLSAAIFDLHGVVTETPGFTPCVSAGVR